MKKFKSGIIPQNIKALVGDIGEKHVLLRLALLAHQNKGWQVFQNVNKSGFDIALINSRKKIIAIEVKTRQKLFSTGKKQNNINFGLSDLEYRTSDFLIAYYLDGNIFLVIKKTKLKRTADGKWGIRLTLRKDGQPHPSFKQYINAWHLLSPDFKETHQ